MALFLLSAEERKEYVTLHDRQKYNLIPRPFNLCIGIVPSVKVRNPENEVDKYQNLHHALAVSNSVHSIIFN